MQWSTRASPILFTENEREIIYGAHFVEGLFDILRRSTNIDEKAFGKIYNNRLFV